MEPFVTQVMELPRPSLPQSSARSVDYGCPPSIRAALQSDLADMFGADASADPDSSGIALHYQPILELATGEIRGYEALVRWFHPVYGPIPPTIVIAIAEDSDLIVALGAWVLDRALRDAVTFGHMGQATRYVSVNVSAEQLRTPGFADGLRHRLAVAGLDPSLLVVEITESLRLDDDDPIWHDLAGLRHLGVRVAIDDYGTGYASLSYLRHPVIDMLKLDQTFLTSIADDRNRTILRSLLALTDELGIDLVAEGIEDVATQLILVDAGCALGQGHLFAAAMPLADLLQWKPEGRAGRRIDLPAATRHPVVDTASTAASRPDALVVSGGDPVLLRTADMFVEIADTLVDDFNLSTFLHMFTERCVHLLNVSAAGLLLADGDGTVQAVAASCEAVRLLDESQVKSGHGPAVDCFRTGSPVTVADLANDGRWPAFAATAVKVGFYVVQVLPMRLRSDTIGALTLLDTTPAPVGSDTLRIGQALADAATIGLVQQRAITSRDIVTKQHQRAFNSRVIIEQAKGAIAERLNITVGEAFIIMHGAARRQNRHLADVARAIIDGAETPSSRPP